MFAVDPGLAAVSLAPMPFVIWVAFRYGRLNRPASQEVQQRIAELTADAEENIGGRARGQGLRAGGAPAAALQPRGAARVRPVDGLHAPARLLLTAASASCPSSAWRPCCSWAAARRCEATITVGEFVAFYGYVLLLTSPMRMLGVSLGMAQRAVASGQRVFEILDREPRADRPPGAPALPPGGGRVELRDVSFAYEGGDAAAARHRPDGRGRRARWRWWAPPAPARPRS